MIILSDIILLLFYFFFSSRRRHTRCLSDWSSDVCSSDLLLSLCIEIRHVPDLISILDLAREQAVARTPRRMVPGAGTYSQARYWTSASWRSEERRVGKECRSRWWPCTYKKREKGYMRGSE